MEDNTDGCLSLALYIREAYNLAVGAENVTRLHGRVGELNMLIT